MNLLFTEAERAFRAEVRDWLESHRPVEIRPLDGRGMADFDIAWQRTQFEGGWAGIAWPLEFGGRGLTTVQQLIWHEEYAKAHAPEIGVCFVGLNHGGPTLIMNATDKQKQQHLPTILRGDHVWCQGFSEPGAGSDLASIRTVGRIEGDSIVVNGQKIWTSWAQWADYQELLVRTEPGSQRHAGLSWLICDMKSPGVTVRPIMTMAGVAEFCEVFYDDVTIPLANVVGGVGNGWRVAMSTLSFERGPGFMAEQMEAARLVEELIETAHHVRAPDGRRPAIQDDGIARTLGELRAEVTALRSMALAGISRAERTGTPGAEASIVRLFMGEVVQKLFRAAMEIIGDESLVLSGWGQGWTRPYLHSFAYSMGGGTSEIQRNIIAERVLGLPRAR